MLWCQGVQNIGLSSHKLKSTLTCTVWSQCTLLPGRRTDRRTLSVSRPFVLTDASRAKIGQCRCGFVRSERRSWSWRQNAEALSHTGSNWRCNHKKDYSYCKTLMFACPLFGEFRVPNKTAKLKGANINCRPKNRDKITTVFRIIWF